MNIANLEQFVEQENRMAALFKSKTLSLLNPADRQRIDPAREEIGDGVIGGADDGRPLHVERGIQQHRHAGLLAEETHGVVFPVHVLTFQIGRAHV